MEFKDLYLIFNFIVGSIYMTWIYWLIYIKKCKCSQTTLQQLIHIYWYVIFMLDLLVFFNVFNVNHYYLLIIGNVLGLINIYMTYRYIYDIKRCRCTDGFLKDTIVIIYISTIVVSILYMLVYLITSYK
jgi:hypothetical protein